MLRIEVCPVQKEIGIAAHARARRKGLTLGGAGLSAARGADPRRFAALRTITLPVTRALDRVTRLRLLRAVDRRGVADLTAYGRANGDQRDLAVQRLQLDGICIVSLRGELDIASTQRLVDVLAETQGPVVIDLTELTFVDARGLSTLICAHRTPMGGDRTVSIRGAKGLVRRMFSLCELDHLLLEA